MILVPGHSRILKGESAHWSNRFRSHCPIQFSSLKSHFHYIYSWVNLDNLVIANLSASSSQYHLFSWYENVNEIYGFVEEFSLFQNLWRYMHLHRLLNGTKCYLFHYKSTSNITYPVASRKSFPSVGLSPKGISRVPAKPCACCISFRVQKDATLWSIGVGGNKVDKKSL